MFRIILVGALFIMGFEKLFSNEPLVTAEKYIEYKRKNGYLENFITPKVVLICYQKSTLKYLLGVYPDLEQSEVFPSLYLTKDNQVAILGDFGIGAPALANKIEQLIVLGVEKFVAVGTAGTLKNKHEIADFIVAPKALAEDGVAHLYLKNQPFASADINLQNQWKEYSKSRNLPEFKNASAWSFSSVFRETLDDINRVINFGYDLVEMEAATLYAIGQEKGVPTLSLFVISDNLGEEAWIPHIKESNVRENLHNLALWAFEFCQEHQKVELVSNQ